MRRRARMDPDEPVTTPMARLVTLTKEKIASAMLIDIDMVDVRSDERMDKSFAYQLTASFTTLKNPDEPPAPKVVYEWATWWDRVKSERFKAAVTLGALSKPRRVAVEQVIHRVIRLCPHLNDGEVGDHLEFVMMDKQPWFDK